MKNLGDALEKYVKAGMAEKPECKAQFFKILVCKLFEYKINDKDFKDLFEDIKKDITERKVEEVNNLIRAFATIGDILF